MNVRRSLIWILLLSIIAIGPSDSRAQEKVIVTNERPCEMLLDCQPRTALLSAFGLEANLYLQEVEREQVYVINGIRFTTGKLGGQDVVIALTNVSLPNAVLAAQLAVLNFRVERIIMSGVAGAVDPAVALGDVVIPERWALYQELWFENPNPSPPPAYFVPKVEPISELADMYGKPGEPAEANFEFMFARKTMVSTPTDPQYPSQDALGFPQSGYRFWFDVDADLLELARSLDGEVELEDCAVPKGGTKEICASQRSGRPPKFDVDGNGVSGPTFVNYAAYREYVFKTFTFDDGGTSPDRVQVLDMESAGVAFVAANNAIPFLVIRTASDLAGGEQSKTLLPVFADLAIANTSTTVLHLLEKL